MNDQLLMLMEKTLKDLRSATSSLESVVGAMHSNLQDGQQIDLFGQEAHHANPSQLPETRKDKTTSDIFPQLSQGSSKSADLQLFLANRLVQQLGQDGSMIYKMTWKQKTTPRRWQYCQLAASVLSTNESECSSYPTPTAAAGGPSKNPLNKRGVNGGNPMATVASLLKTEKSDQSQLNPRFSLWLMGFPIEWAYCGERVTLSSRKSRQKS